MKFMHVLVMHARDKDIDLKRISLFVVIETVFYHLEPMVLKLRTRMVSDTSM